MEKRIVIRNENPSDYDKVEALTREAFYIYTFQDAWSIIWCIS